MTRIIKTVVANNLFTINRGLAVHTEERIIPDIQESSYLLS